jgi:hypothetical protein
MAPVLVDFVVQSLSGIVGVFLGVWLALLMDRHRRRREEEEREEQRGKLHGRARHTVLGSIVKNVAEAKRLRARLERRKSCELIHSSLEIAVGDAIQSEFMQACHSIDERVLFAQFFDGVRRLQAFFEFHRDLQLSIAGAADAHDPELARVGRDADQHLQELADDLRLNGLLLITDYGEPVHRKMMGLKADSPADDGAPAAP